MRAHRPRRTCGSTPTRRRSGSADSARRRGRSSDAAGCARGCLSFGRQVQGEHTITYSGPEPCEGEGKGQRKGQGHSIRHRAVFREGGRNPSSPASGCSGPGNTTAADGRHVISYRGEARVQRHHQSQADESGSLTGTPIRGGMASQSDRLQQSAIEVGPSPQQSGTRKKLQFYFANVTSWSQRAEDYLKTRLATMSQSDVLAIVEHHRRGPALVQMVKRLRRMGWATSAVVADALGAAASGHGGGSLGAHVATEVPYSGM